jgi:hypothetical protein
VRFAAEHIKALAKKIRMSKRLATRKGYTATGGIKNCNIFVYEIYKLQRGIFISGKSHKSMRASRNTDVTKRSISVSSLRCIKTSSARDTAVWCAEILRLKALPLWIMTPLARERTALKKDRHSYSRTVIGGELFY